MSPLTPQELDRAEREINLNLAQHDPPLAVCLHPDRSLVHRGDALVTECDYCPAWASQLNGVPDLMPYTYPLVRPS